MKSFRNTWVKYLTDQRGITGLETAIVLIAFVVVASVFAFTVLTTGLFTSQEAKNASESAIRSSESTLKRVGAFVAGGPCIPGNGGDLSGCNTAGGMIDWSNCPDRSSPVLSVGYPVDMGGDCDAHAQLFRFKLSAAGKEAVDFDPTKTLITWFDTGGRPEDGPVFGDLVLRGEIDETLVGTSEAFTDCLSDSMWCYRWQTGETDQILDIDEYVEIFIGGSSGILHGGYVSGGSCGGGDCNGVEKNSNIVVEVITRDGAVLQIQGRMPGVIQQIMSIDR
jgi:flagellin-like protein